MASIISDVSRTASHHDSAHEPVNRPHDSASAAGCSTSAVSHNHQQDNAQVQPLGSSFRETKPCQSAMAPAVAKQQPSHVHPGVWDGSDISCLDEPEYVELMLAMEQALYDSQHDAAASEAAFAKEEEDDDEIASMLEVLRLREPEEGDLGVLCPICKSAYLYQGADGSFRCREDHGVIIDGTFDGKSRNLEHLRDCMGAALEAHALSGCSGSIGFHVRLVQGRSCLLCMCDGCSWSGLV